MRRRREHSRLSKVCRGQISGSNLFRLELRVLGGREGTGEMKMERKAGARWAGSV
jgi:hypothetical protein